GAQRSPPQAPTWIGMALAKDSGAGGSARSSLPTLAGVITESNRMTFSVQTGPRHPRNTRLGPFLRVRSPTRELTRLFYRWLFDRTPVRCAKGGNDHVAATEGARRIASC